jgi:hypothetical protein
MAAKRKTQAALSAERVKLHLQSRFNPIRGLTPDTLSSHLENFDLGYLRYAALAWQKIKDRDDTVLAVTEKRELQVSLLDWDILTIDDSPEATRHKEALEDFYNNLTATDAIDSNRRGGVALLVRQMMQAVGHKYAVHEIVWNPRGAAFTAEFRFVPLQFFENTTGRLRFLQQEGAAQGVDLEDDGWMVTVGRGLMEATSVAYLFKQLPLKDWLILCEKFGLPGLHGKTDAKEGSEEWSKMRDALANFGIDWAILTNLAAQVETIEVKNAGNQPHPALVDRMDRAIARLWLGGDLSTMSKDGAAVGSMPQDNQAEILERADAEMITETLQHYVDAAVIRYRFGNAQPKAYFKLKPTVDVNIERELKVDEFLLRSGVPRGINELLRRYNRPEPDAGDELAKAPAAAPAPGTGAPLANQYFSQAELRSRGRESLFKAAAAKRLTAAQQEAFRPVADRLQAIANAPTEAEQRSLVARFRADLPDLSAQVMAKAPELAAVLEEVIGTALVDGFASAAEARKPAALANSRPGARWVQALSAFLNRPMKRPFLG